MQILLEKSVDSNYHYNGDIYGSDNNLYYICDGSTALFDDYKFFKTGDLYEYMQLIKKNIKEKENISDSFKEAIIESNKSIATYYLYEEMELPSFTISAILEKKDTIEFLMLGDCLIAVLTKTGEVELIDDRRLDSLTINLKKEFKKINENNDLTEEEKQKACLLVDQKFRKLENSFETNYFVASTNALSIDQSIVGSINKNEVDRILICSDGFYNGIDEKPLNKEDFEEEAIEKRLKEKISSIKHDDVTFMLLKNID